MSQGSGDPTLRPRILLVGGGPLQLELVRAAQRYGDVVVFDASPRAPALALADHARIVDLSRSADVMRAARELGVTAVLPAPDDAAMPAVNAVAREIALPGTHGDAAARCRDKWACFRALCRGPHAVPATHLVSDVDQARTAADALGGYPVVVKPRCGDAGRGVHVVRAQAELSAAVSCAHRAYGPGEHAVLVQAFVPGRAIGVEAFFVAGELARAFVLDDQFEADFVSPAGHALPSTLSQPEIDSVCAAVATFGRALGLRDGPANFDLRYEAGRTTLLEVNPRLGGNSITDLIRLAHGVDLAQASVCCALGLDPRPLLWSQQPIEPRAARMILKSDRGMPCIPDEAAERVCAQSATASEASPSALHTAQPAQCGAGANSAWHEHPDVIALELHDAERERVHARADGWTVLGRTIVRGTDSASAARLAEEIAHDIARRVRFKPP